MRTILALMLVFGIITVASDAGRAGPYATAARKRTGGRAAAGRTDKERKDVIRLLSTLFLAIAVGLTACSSDNGGDQMAPSLRVVSRSLDSNMFGVTNSDLKTASNPKGDGTFVYVEQTRFSGVERFIIWLVLDGVAYPLNGATKDITPGLPWPADADPAVWAPTSLSTVDAREALSIVFGTNAGNENGEDGIPEVEGEVVTTASGLQIIDVEVGEGDAAEPGQRVSVHYTGYLEDGTIFDDSVQRGEPIAFSLERVIQGWQEGIPGMQVGGKRRLIIPPELAYGENPPGDIPANATLIFDVQLLELIR